MRAILLLAVLLMAMPALAQQQPRLPQAPKLETAQDWYRAVSGRLQRAGGRIVAQAARDGLAGRFEARVGFTVSADGTVSAISLVESSRDDAVDALALLFPERAAPFPRFTPDMTAEPKSIVAPLQLHFEPPSRLFVACDNGLRCVREPCPSRDIVLLPSGERLEKTSPDLSGLSPEDEARLREADGLYHGSIVLEGTVAGGAVVATRVVRDAAAEEAALCRQR